MHWLRVVGFAFVTSIVAAGCARGRDVKSAGKEDKLAFDESGKGRKCETPSSSCDEVKEPSLDFKEKCREGGYRMKQCGCDDLCTGNINGTRTGFNSKNQLKTCKDSTETCQDEETSAAYQDACDGVDGEMMECGCEWLCSKQLKNAIADAPKDDAKSGDDASADDASSKPKDDKPHGNMDGKAGSDASKASNSTKSSSTKSNSTKSNSTKSSSTKSSSTKSNSTKSSSGDSSSGSDNSSGDKRKGRFSDPDE